MALPNPSDISLAPVTMRCAPRMYAWMLDPDVRDNIGLRGEPSLERTRQWITKARRDETMRPLAIHKAGQHVGNVTLDRIDRFNGSARLSIYIGEPSARHGGVGRAAVGLALREAFGPMSLHKVWLTVHSRNTGAIAAYASCGFEVEGVLRDEFLLRGERLPLIYMGCLEPARRGKRPSR